MFLFYFIFLWGYYGGALVFLGGAGAPASPSLALPMPKGILGWASGAECIERAERNLQKGALRSKGNMTAPLRSHALVANPMNFVSVRHKKNKWFTRRDLPCPAASSVDGITDYNGFYSILSRCTAPLESGVDTVRAMQMQVNTEFRSLPRLFVLLYLSMFVICLFFYANLLAYKIMIIDYFFFPNRAFQVIWCFFFSFSYRNIYRRNTKYHNVSFFPISCSPSCNNTYRDYLAENGKKKYSESAAWAHAVICLLARVQSARKICAETVLLVSCSVTFLWNFSIP